MDMTADAIVVGAGVQGASIAFHLARRGVRVLVVERGTVAGGATGRSSGFVRMHYDLESEARLAWTSFPYFTHWREIVGDGDPGFVQTGFVQLVPGQLDANLRANVEMHQRVGIDTRVISSADLADLVPGIVTDDIDIAAYEPKSGYADPTATTSGFLAAAKRLGARLVLGCRADRVVVDAGRVVGLSTDVGAYHAPVVVDVAGAWAPALAATVGVDVPVQAWRHDTAYLGLPSDRTTDFPIVLDDAGGVYFRPEGRDLMLVGLEAGNELGGSPDRPLASIRTDSIEEMIRRVCDRVPWMTAGTLRTAHGGQDGITPDQRAILGAAGPDGFYLACGFSGTGFKTAPAIGAAFAELIVDGGPAEAIADFALRRFPEGRLLKGEHPYEMLWR